MSFRVTQCPSCESTFNTNPRVLATAAGKVRCGACLTVFEATENFITDESQTDRESVFVSFAPEDYFDPSVFLTRSALREPSAAEDPNPEPTPGKDGTDADGAVEYDFFTAITTALDDDPGDRPDQDNTDDEQIVDLSEFEPDIEEQAEPPPREAEASVDEIRARALRAELEDEEALTAIPRENLAVLSQFSSPVEFFTGRHRHWRQQIGWSLICLALMAALAGQYLWREMAVYSQSAGIRPVYEWACGFLDCNLPPYSDIDAIRSDILTVRSHPREDNGLLVNIEFRNTAPFPQAFPILVLSFNSAGNSVIALREFAPREYLDEQFNRMALMPSMNPVQINLEIMDPGPDAVNYTLAFRRP